MTKRYVPSRFNVRAKGDEGEFLLANLMMGAFGAVEDEKLDVVSQALKKTGVEVEHPEGVIADLIEGGFLVPDTVDEFRRATYLHETGIHRSDGLFLTIMPTEQCNFRCVYCYESFARESMLPEVRTGLIQYVRNRARGLNDLFVDWFGGEPLIAFDVIKELSQGFMQICAENDIPYGASMTTNGYHLSIDMMQECLKYNINRFQITIDGNIHQHDQRRILRGGGKTFEVIFNNLIELHNTDFPFEIDLRCNFDMDSLPNMEEYIDLVVEKIGNDPRFSMRFRRVGRLGGPNDENLPVCSDRGASQYKLTEMAIEKGLHARDTGSILRPHAFVCYANQTFSFVIGADGTVYKCTVALDEEYNKVGRIHSDGTMDLDLDLMALWTTSDETIDSGCQSCFFRPSCQGAACPLVRIKTGKAPCPDEKYHVKDSMRLTWMQHKRSLNAVETQ